MTEPETERTFDRIPSYDHLSLGYPVRPLLAGKPPRSYTWSTVQLNQGSEGACTGFAVTMRVASRPQAFFGQPKTVPLAQIPVINQVARDVYHRAQQIDEWPGENYEGSSVLAAAKVGVERRWWPEYRWALGPGAAAAADDVIRSIANVGPVVMGSWWWSGMMTAGKDGYLRPQGHRVGGHAWIINRYSAKRDAVWTPNSWGGAGQGWISRADLEALLADEGEACIVVVRKTAP